MAVYNCKSYGWMTEKECQNCFKKNKSDQYGHVKHCRRDNVSETEDNNMRDE